MSTRETLSTIASACAIVAFVAGTAASTIYAGIVFLGGVSAGFVVVSLWEGVREAQKGEVLTMEALKPFSARELSVALAYFLGMALLMAWDYSDRGSTWNESFGLCQLAGAILAAAAAVLVIGEVRWHIDRRYKRCPDCAGKVLAEARKCQHCSYRFITE